MDMGMVEQGARPSVEHRDASDLRTDIAGVRRQPLDGSGGTAKQRAVDDRLMSDGERTQLRRQGHGNQIVGAGQEPRAMALQPARGLIPAALRTMSVAARVIAVDEAGTRG